MIAIRNVLCPVDFSDFSKHALDHAIAVAHRYDSEVTVLHVCPDVPALAYAAGGLPLEPMVLTDADRERLMLDLRQFADCDEAARVHVRPVVQGRRNGPRDSG